MILSLADYIGIPENDLLSFVQPLLASGVRVAGIKSTPVIKQDGPTCLSRGGVDIVEQCSTLAKLALRSGVIDRAANKAPHELRMLNMDAAFLPEWRVPTGRRQRPGLQGPAPHNCSFFKEPGGTAGRPGRTGVSSGNVYE